MHGQLRARLRVREALVHGALPWLPTDRQRRVLVLRYRPHTQDSRSFPPEILARLAPETRELAAPMGTEGVKDVAKMRVVTLSEGGSARASL